MQPSLEQNQRSGRHIILLTPMKSMVDTPLFPRTASPEGTNQAGPWTKRIFLSWIEEKVQELWSHTWVGIQVLPLLY